jgi:hypothetical protein
MPPDTGNDKGKGGIVPVHAMKAYGGSRGTTPLILYTRRSWVSNTYPAALPSKPDAR